MQVATAPTEEPRGYRGTDRAAVEDVQALYVELCSRSFIYPFECPCCGAPPDGEVIAPLRTSHRPLANDTAQQMLFPYCRSCVSHVEHWERGALTSAAVTVFAIAAGAALGWATGLTSGIVAFVALALLGRWIGARIRTRAARRCDRSCASAARAVDYHGWNGSTSTFRFASPAYTVRFAEHNVHNLVSVSRELERLLDANLEARRRAPTPAAAVATCPWPTSASAWLLHVERQPAQVLRRMAVTRALASLGSATDRDAIVMAACVHELAPLLAQLERAPFHLQRARIAELAEQVSADNLPPAVGSALLAELERRLRETRVDDP